MKKKKQKDIFFLKVSHVHNPYLEQRERVCGTSSELSQRGAPTPSTVSQLRLGILTSLLPRQKHFHSTILHIS